MEKHQGVEFLRIVSAFGVVWFHTSPICKDLAYSGLISFLILSMYFSSNPNSITKPILVRVRKILFPWILWLVFYGLINVIQKKTFIHGENGFISKILAGTSIHLWYMPFIFMAIILFDQIKKHINDRSLAYACACLITLKIITMPLWVNWSSHLNAPYGQYFNAVDGILIGVFLANSERLSKTLQIGLVTTVILILLMLTLLTENSGLSYLIGITITSLIVLFNWNFNLHLNVNWLSECTLGIYLIHPFWYLVVYKFSQPSVWAIPILTFLISAISIFFLKKFFPKLSKYAI